MIQANCPELSTRPLSAYADSLQKLVEAVCSTGVIIDAETVNGALDGKPAGELRRRIELDIRRRISAFPTSSDLRSQAINLPELPPGKIMDPACGLGDLLIEAARKLPCKDSLRETVSDWSERLCGTDVSEEFIRIAKLRLLLQAACRHNGGTLSAAQRAAAFPLIKCGDGLSASYDQVGLVLMNPPFHALAAGSCEWATGHVSAAALFLDHVSQSIPPECEVIAIIPDVLRSGTRYERWRRHIESLVQVCSVGTYGKFDDWTDVHVAILRLKKVPKVCTSASWFPAKATLTLGDVAELCVGPVVPHRHDQGGENYPYATARSLSGHRELAPGALPLAQFIARLESGPFLAVRRTSRPDDRKRVIVTKIIGVGPVLVENHLIIVRPRKSSGLSIDTLLAILEDSKTDKWLNQRLCCRHLTVRALKELPIEEDYLENG